MRKIKSIGSYIKTRRKSLRLTQSDIAVKIGISPQAVSKWERGESLPDVVLFPELAEILQTTIETILSGGEETTKSKTVDSLDLSNLQDIIGKIIDDELFEAIFSEFIKTNHIKELRIEVEVFRFLNNVQKDKLLDVLLEIEGAYSVIDDIIPFLNNSQRLSIVEHQLANCCYEELHQMLPFLTKTAMSFILSELLAIENFEVIEDIMTYLTKNHKNELIDYFIKNDTDSEIIENFIPFFDKYQKIRIARYEEENNE